MSTWKSKIASVAGAGAFLVCIFLVSLYFPVVGEILRIVFAIARLFH